MNERGHMTEVKKKKLVTPEFRGSYVNLAKPRSVGTGDPRYSILMPLPESDPFVKIMQEREKEVAIEKWGKVPKKLKSALKFGADREGDEDGVDEFEGCVTVNFSSADEPGLVYFDEDGDKAAITDKKMLYSGAFYRVSTRPYAWEHETGGRGVSWSLDNVLWVRGGTPISGRGNAEDDFSNIKPSASNDDDDMLD